MIRSSSFDSTKRLEIGRYEEASVGSRRGFFITGVTDASLKSAGKRPDSRERLKSSATNGVMMSEMCFMTYVGMRSAAEHLSGSRRMASTTSLADRPTGVNVRSETPERTLEKLGNGLRQWQPGFWPPSQKSSKKYAEYVIN